MARKQQIFESFIDVFFFLEKWLLTNPECAGGSTYSCERLALVLREHNGGFKKGPAFDDILFSHLDENCQSYES